MSEPLPLTMTVPEAGRRLYGIGRDASYAAAESGDIPARRVGGRLVVPTHAALKHLGWSDDLIARALGIAANTNGPSATEEPLATIHALTTSTGEHQDATRAL